MNERLIGKGIIGVLSIIAPLLWQQLAALPQMSNPTNSRVHGKSTLVSLRNDSSEPVLISRVHITNTREIGLRSVVQADHVSKTILIDNPIYLSSRLLERGENQLQSLDIQVQPHQTIYLALVASQSENQKAFSVDVKIDYLNDHGNDHLTVSNVFVKVDREIKIAPPSPYRERLLPAPDNYRFTRKEQRKAHKQDKRSNKSIRHG